jgi:hypothetical protein
MPSSGHSIIIGRDYITGLGPTSILSPPVIEHLNNKNIHYLYQAVIYNVHRYVIDGWISSHDLALSPNLTVEWKGYCMDLT